MIKEEKKRHYCYLCGSKRYESEMEVYCRAAYGKFTWKCIKCGDSRFTFEPERKVNKETGRSTMKFLPMNKITSNPRL